MANSRASSLVNSIVWRVCAAIVLPTAGMVGAWLARGGDVATGVAVGLGVGGVAAVVGCLTVVRAVRRRLRPALEQMRRAADGEASDSGNGAADAFPELAEAAVRVRLALAASEDKAGQLRRELDQTRQALDALTQTQAGDLGMSRSVFADPLDATGELLNRLGPDLHWLRSSQPEAQLLGWAADELVGRDYLEVVCPEDRDAVRGMFAECRKTGEIHDMVYRVRTSDGQVRHLQVDASARYDGAGKCMAIRCHSRDVTDQVRAEQQLRRRTGELGKANSQLRHANAELERLKNRYSDLYHNSPVMYYSLDHEGVIVGCNDTMVKALGYRRDQLIGRPYSVLLTDDMKSVFEATFEAFKRQGELALATQWRHSDGRVIDVQVRGTAMRDGNGRFMRSRSVAEDITDRLYMERRLQREAEKLAETNKRLLAVNKELDDFTYVVSHDLKEPLRTIQAFSRFLARDYEEKLDAEGREFLDYLGQASIRMKLMIDGVLELSRIGRVASAPGEIVLADVLAESRQDLRELLRDRSAELIVHEPLPMLWGDRTRIGQLLTNLISNGVKYNESEGARVEVGTLAPGEASLAPDPPPAEELGAPLPGQRIVYVRDNGIGIAEDSVDRVFQLFHRLHRRDEYEGTGAGLAICKKIVDAHGGRLWVQSKPGQGATFYVSLPGQRSAAGEKEAGS